MQTTWPGILQSVLRQTYPNVWVINGAVRASSADLAALCFDELWGPQWIDANGAARAPRLDLAIVEYSWTSSQEQVDALIEALHRRAVPVLAFHYYHAVNPYRAFAKTKKGQAPDPTPGWSGEGGQARRV